MAKINADHLARRILLVKTSSLGDVLHNLPVVTDIRHHFPDARIDWLVEESFAALPKLHPAVQDVIPVALRRWRKMLFRPSIWHEIKAFRTLLKSREYDFAIDTQGLLKSALLMYGAHGLRCGYDNHSARESFASNFYQMKCAVSIGQHAVERNRQLVSKVLGYSLDEPADYGIQSPAIKKFNWLEDGTYVALLHSTSRTDKLWDEANWILLGRTLKEEGIRSILPWGNESERSRSLRLGRSIPGAVTPPRLSLEEAAALLGNAHAVIGVDTGLAHLAAALSVPTIGIYTATDPTLTGLYAGKNVINLGGINQSPDALAVLESLKLITS